MKIVKSRVISVLLLFVSCWTQAQTNLLPADFAKNYRYTYAEISPDGKHIAVGVVQEGKHNMLVLETNTFSPVGAAAFAGAQQVGDFYWVNDERIVIKVLEKRAWMEEPQFYGELYAINYDGKKGEMIYGYRAGESTIGTRIAKKKGTRGWAQIIDIMPDDEKHILISSTPMSEGQDKYPTVHKLNVYSGKMSSPITKAPVSYTRFITDEDHVVRFAIGYNEDNETEFYKHFPEDRKWEMYSSDDFGDAFWPLSLDSTGKNLYYLDNFNRDHTGLYKLSLESGKKKHIYTEEDVSITNVTFSSDEQSAYAVRVDSDYPAYVVFNKKSDEAQIFKSLLATFPGHKVQITSSSKDGNTFVVLTSSDISPGDFYLYQKDKNNLAPLFSYMPSAQQQFMSESFPIDFVATDGTKIKGYLSYPVKMKEGEKVPLVTLVHGGPHGVRDFWTYDREVQLLANEGYAVLRVNYRGSAGYGQSFREAGFKRWGDLVQQDIIDGTNWAIAQGKIDQDKVCIMGSSFGGYASVQSAILANNLYKCVVATAGIYDLELMYDAGDIPEKLFGEAYLESVIGLDEETLKRFSPVNNINRLKAPVLIAHGEQDERVPVEHAEALKDKLDEAGKPYEWFVRSTETHGFFNEQNRTEYYEKVTSFLGKFLH